jgi:drug/metabolite transporter (DMT)-like permease
MLAAGLLALVLAPATGGFTRAPISLGSGLALGYLVGFGSILAYSAYIYLAKVWPPARAGTYAYWNPVVAVLLGWMMRSEVFHGRMLPGLGLILLGVGLIQVPGSWLRRYPVTLPPREADEVPAE